MGAIKSKQDLSEAMGRIESEAIRMSALVESLLTLTRMDELGNLKKEPTDLVGLAKESIRDVAVTNQSVSFRLSSAPSELIIAIDPDQIRQVMTNLLANASRFAPSSSEVSVEIIEDETKVVVKVIDHGEGIPPTLTEKIFERFYRVDNSRNRETGGSGLGLAIAKSFIDAHGGNIWVEETPGSGATFCIQLAK
jgi:two-component system OmpR family sensor kinase